MIKIDIREGKERCVGMMRVKIAFRRTSGGWEMEGQQIFSLAVQQAESTPELIINGSIINHWQA